VKGLKTLIRLHKKEVDDRRRHLVELQTMAEQVEHRRRLFEEEVEQEKLIAGSSLEASMTYGAFVGQVRQRREQFAQVQRDIAAKINQAEQALTDAFQELKRFELAEEERVRQERAKFARAEALMLDEVASQRFQRQQEE